MDSLINFINLESNSLADLQAFARTQLGIRSVTTLRKKELIELIREKLREESIRQSNAAAAAQTAQEPSNNVQITDKEEASFPSQSVVSEQMGTQEKPVVRRGRPRKKPIEQEGDQSLAIQKEAVEKAIYKKLLSTRTSSNEAVPAAEPEKSSGEPLSETASAAPQQKPQIDLSNASPVQGILEIVTDGYGFLRSKNYYLSDKDVYVSNGMIKKQGLRNGDFIKGLALPVRSGEKFPPLCMVESINGIPYSRDNVRPNFDALTPVFPDSRLTLETITNPNELATRIIDLIAPIGKGQRGLIVSPPKAGKTMLLKKIANAITTNYPDVKLIILLIDERPEEVTDIQRSTNVEVAYSTFDELPEHHTKISEIVLEHSKRLVEQGQDVVILMDSITRLARAYNITVPVSGRSLSGGLDPSALFKPKKFFGAARNIENGGSLTIIATALIETGSRMDEVIFEEFKGTGNMEIHLDHKLSERRIFPAIDLNKSGTRREDLLLSKRELDSVQLMRKNLSEGRTDKVAEYIINTLASTKNNDQFITKIMENFASAEKTRAADDIIISNLFNY